MYERGSEYITIIENVLGLSLKYIKQRQSLAKEDAWWYVARMILEGETLEAIEAYFENDPDETLIEIIDVLLPAVFHLMGWSASQVIKVETSGGAATIYDANLERSLFHVLERIADARGLQGLRSVEAMMIINQIFYILKEFFSPQEILEAVQLKFAKDSQNYPAFLFQDGFTDRERQLYLQLYPNLSEAIILSLRHNYRSRVLKLIRGVAKEVFDHGEYDANIDGDLIEIFKLVFTEYGVHDQALHKAFYLLTALKHFIHDRKEKNHIENIEIRKLLRTVQGEVDRDLITQTLDHDGSIAALPIGDFRGIVNRVIDKKLLKVMDYKERASFWKKVEEDYGQLLARRLHDHSRVE